MWVEVDRSEFRRNQSKEKYDFVIFQDDIEVSSPSWFALPPPRENGFLPLVDRRKKNSIHLLKFEKNLKKQNIFIHLL
jgi:hypothetical protein